MSEAAVFGFPDPEPDSRKSTVLVVDDEPLNLTVLGQLLEPRYRVRVANSGTVALRAAGSEPRPDLILLDIMMPDMDGYEVLRCLRSDPATRDIPVVFVTAIVDEAAEQKGFELGAADYVHKPICGPIVLARVRAQLDAKMARDILRKNSERLALQVEEGSHALEQIQLQLLHSEKMAAMGQLAAGVAHEINNPIGFVGSNLGSLDNYLHSVLAVVAAYERAEAGLPDNPAFAEAQRLKRELNFDFLRQDIPNLIAESIGGIDRVRKIVLDLKNFSRAGSTEWQWADLHAELESTINIVWNELKYHCTLIRNYGELPRVNCLPSQLNQVFMNLLVNAGQAVAAKGEITITTDRPDEDHVRIRVSDTGSGMTPEVMAHIFEPFFTTKPVGKGTGLGLSLAWGIIERHHGKIEVASEPGRGTTFSITLPVDASQGEATEDSI